MSYDHSNKIGNQGDVVKHVALLASFRHLLNAAQEGQEFVYADIHAGRPQYSLSEMGEWRHGIGVFSTTQDVVEDRTLRQTGASLLGEVGIFDSLFVGRTVTPGMTYTGSSGIALRLLSESKQPWRMKLWEKDPAAADDIKAHFSAFEDRVTLVCGDGYEIVNDETPISFALIDPPALEANAVIETMSRFHARGTPFLCWTPRTSRSVMPSTSDEKWSAAEARTSTDYSRAAAAFGSCFRIQWHPWGSRIPGCCITASATLASAAADALRQATRLMGWQFEG